MLGWLGLFGGALRAHFVERTLDASSGACSVIGDRRLNSILVSAGGIHGKRVTGSKVC